MALGLSYRCSCGERFKIYLPKKKVYGETVSSAVDWAAIDEREEADGEIDDVKQVALSTGCTFVDGRYTEQLTCPGCTTELDLIGHFREHILKV